jgi:predicted DNA-binding WGR domain protein
VSWVYLARREPSRNLARFYRMAIVPTLFGGWALWREWGRIGSGGQVRADQFPNAGAALLALQALVRAKKKRGYKVLQDGTE